MSEEAINDLPCNSPSSRFRRPLLAETPLNRIRSAYWVQGRESYTIASPYLKTFYSSVEVKKDKKRYY